MDQHFPDGSVLHKDPRREDPLICHLPRPKAWKDAIGFAIDPLFQEHEAAAVTLRVFQAHEERLKQLTDRSIAIILEHLAAVTGPWFPNWHSLSLAWPDWLTARLGNGAIVAPFLAQGWQVDSAEHVGVRLVRPGRTASTPGV